MAQGIKTGGRQSGTPNRTTKEIREHFQNLIAENLEILNDDLKELEPLQRLKMIIELSKFVVPTLKAIESKNQNELHIEPLKIQLLTPAQRTELNKELESEY